MEWNGPGTPAPGDGMEQNGHPPWMEWQWNGDGNCPPIRPATRQRPHPLITVHHSLTTAHRHLRAPLTALTGMGCRTRSLGGRPWGRAVPTQRTRWWSAEVTGLRLIAPGVGESRWRGSWPWLRTR